MVGFAEDKDITHMCDVWAWHVQCQADPAAIDTLGTDRAAREQIMSKLQSISLSPLADQRGLKPGTQTFGVDATGKAVAVPQGYYQWATKQQQDLMSIFGALLARLEDAVAQQGLIRAHCCPCQGVSLG
jgi:hypothetical protein